MNEEEVQSILKVDAKGGHASLHQITSYAIKFYLDKTRIRVTYRK